MRLADLFVCTAVLDGGPALGKAELVGRLLAVLAQAGHLAAADLPAILAAVLRRERLGSTGIGRGVAVPQARHAAVPRPLGVLATCRTPVEYDAIDGEPVDVVALILSPPDRPGTHLGETSRRYEGLTRHLADEGFCRRLRQARSAEEIEELLEGDGGMTRREWLACTDPAAMLRLLRDRRLIGERKARLFGAACCRRHWNLLPDEGRRAVEATERHADGLVGRAEWDAVRGAFTAGLGEAFGPAIFANAAVSYLVAEAGTDPAGYALDLSPWAAAAGEDREGELAAQADILRCLCGPFRAAVVQPAWLAFGAGVVPRLAQAIYDERGFDRLPILADALEEAGCDNAEILAHGRGPGPHVRGCWLIDLLTGRG